MDLRTMADLGAWVRDVRKREGLTQMDLANRMGVAQSWVSKLESGAPRVHAQMVLDALAALGSPLQAEEGRIHVHHADPGRNKDLETAASEEPPRDMPDDRPAPDPHDPFADVFSRLHSRNR